MGSKKYKQIAFLKKIGFLIRYNDLELYHGRCQDEKIEWKVREDVDNSSLIERDNIMGVPCLCVASYGIAERYAQGASFGGQNGKARVYEIISPDEDALVVNEMFDVDKLSDNDKMKFNQAIQSLLKGALKAFLEGAKEEVVLSEVRNRFCQLISQHEEGQLNNVLPMAIEKNIVSKVVGAINAKHLFEIQPVLTVSNFVFGASNKRDSFCQGEEKFSINQDFIRFVMDRNDIIALKKKAFSGEKDDIVYVFNLAKVQKAEDLERDLV